MQPHLKTPLISIFIFCLSGLLLLTLVNSESAPQPNYSELTNLSQTCLNGQVYYFTGTKENPQTLAPMFYQGSTKKCKLNEK
jgi:hypothetical protein